MLNTSLDCGVRCGSARKVLSLDEPFRESLRKRLMSALQDILQFDESPDLQAAARRRFLELSEDVRR